MYILGVNGFSQRFMLKFSRGVALWIKNPLFIYVPWTRRPDKLQNWAGSTRFLWPGKRRAALGYGQVLASLKSAAASRADFVAISLGG